MTGLTPLPDEASHLEIERKYLLKAMPLLPAANSREPIEVWRIDQGYLPDHVDTTAAGEPPRLRGRLRRIVSLADGSVRHVHTIKRGTGLVRQEIEHDIPRETFDQEWPRTHGVRLVKVRSRVRVGDMVWEIDLFEQPAGLVLAEVELPRESALVDLPPWLRVVLDREVTDDPAFTNRAIASRGKAT